MTIKFDGDLPDSDYLEQLSTATGLEDYSNPSTVDFGFWEFQLEENASLEAIIDELYSYPEIRWVNPVFLLENGKSAYASDQIVLRFKSYVTESEQQELLDSLGLSLDEPAGDVFPFEVVSLTEYSDNDVFQTSRLLFESGLCRYAAPNLYGNMDDLPGGPTDNLFPAEDWGYYLLDGSRYSLEPSDSIVTILFSEEEPGDQLMTTLQLSTALEDNYVPFEAGHGFWQFGVESGTDLDLLIEDLLSNQEILLVNPVFELVNGSLMYASHEIILRPRETTMQQEIDAVFSLYDVDVLMSADEVFPFYLVELTIDSPASVFGVSDGIYETGLFRYANPNFYGETDELLSPPNDTYYPNQWHLNHPPNLPGIAGVDIDMEDAWEYAVGDTGVVIAIIDTAFDLDHVDLSLAKLIAPYDAGSSDYSRHVPDNDPRHPNFQDPWFWHGTPCLGMFHSITNNSAGIAAPASNLYFMPIKMYDDQGARDELTAAMAWAWAVYLDVEAISFSIGFGSNLNSVNDLIDEAFDRGIPVVCAAGNSGGSVSYPANLPKTFAVGATDENDVVTSFSNRGPKIDLVAPGISLYSLDVTGELGFTSSSNNPCNIDIDYMCNWGGTSAATPLVAGIAGLVASRRADLKCDTCTAESIYEVLRHSAEDEINGSDPAGYDSTYGWGRLNADRALMAVVRGDANNDGQITIEDAAYIIDYIFGRGLEPQPKLGVGDADNNGQISITDSAYIINYIFGGGPPPAISFRYDY